MSLSVVSEDASTGDGKDKERCTDGDCVDGEGAPAAPRGEGPDTAGDAVP